MSVEAKLVWVARKKCGCIIGAEMDDNDQHKLGSDDILDWVRQGYTVTLEPGPVTILNCAEHHRLAMMNKIKNGTTGKVYRTIDKDQLTLVIKPFLVGFASRVLEVGEPADYQAVTDKLADLIVENYGKWPKS